MWCCKREICLWCSIEMRFVYDSYWSRDYHDVTESRVCLSETRSVLDITCSSARVDYCAPSWVETTTLRPLNPHRSEREPFILLRPSSYLHRHRMHLKDVTVPARWLLKLQVATLARPCLIFFSDISKFKIYMFVVIYLIMEYII